MIIIGLTLTHLAQALISFPKGLSMKLSEIKKHPNFPFRNFRKNDLEFLLLELYWATLFKETIGEPSHTQWVAEFPADREEGNPILFLANRRATPPRIIRIIQRFNEQHLPEFNLDTFDDLSFKNDAYVPFVPGVTVGALDEDMVTPIDELVISSDISNCCERYVREYIRLWCDELIPSEELNDCIDKFWNAVNEHLFLQTDSAET